MASGEKQPLGVDLAAIDVSPHASTAAKPVACNGCHQNETRYRYPHNENAAETLHDFALDVSNNCQGCHYPHTPFHNTEQTDYTPPVCVDCHGSHSIDRVATMVASMPANCVKCHTDKTVAWATDFVAPRAGFGHGAEGYAGSTRCAGCHEDKYFSWEKTLHAKLVQDPAKSQTAVVGDFSKDDPNRPFTLADVSYTLGSQWKQLYLTQTVSNTFHILPAEWIVADGKWTTYHPTDWQTSDWRKECGSCHVTGLETTDWTFTEFGVGCESCHGPGAAHAADPQNIKPYAKVDNQVCGSCHSRGTSPDGFNFPSTYRPGDPLTDHFTFTTTAEALWPDGSAKWNQQQYMDWNLGSTMTEPGKTDCTTCHAVHDTGVADGQLIKESTALCLDCHDQQGALAKHTPFHEQAMQKNDFSCVDCHMPKMATSATLFDLRNHSFMQPDPQTSIDHGGVANMPNACNQCHQDVGEDPQWAAQTISFAKEQSKPTGGFYGPGPTPTPPMPPTPMASVGQPVVTSQIPSFLWVRRTLMGMVAVVVMLILAWLFYWIRTRRKQHA